MPTRTPAELAQRALQSGLDPATPAVAVEQATRKDERIIAASTADLPARLAAAAPPGPVLVMIGRVFAEYLRASEATVQNTASPRRSHALPRWAYRALAARVQFLGNAGHAATQIARALKA